MRIGIGVTTFNRPDCLKECLTNINKHSFGHTLAIYVAEDTDKDRRGVAYRKNECLRALRNCDFVFLFDDDCFPVKDGWIDFFINSGEEHLLYLDSRFHKREYTMITSKANIDVHSQCGGVFMFMNKAVIERVGAFDESYGLWGFEHADYSNRVYGKYGKYLSLDRTNEYIYAHDYLTPNHASTITPLERFNFVEKNKHKYWNEEIKSIHLPL